MFILILFLTTALFLPVITLVVLATWASGVPGHVDKKKPATKGDESDRCHSQDEPHELVGTAAVLAACLDDPHSATRMWAVKTIGQLDARTTRAAVPLIRSAIRKETNRDVRKLMNDVLCKLDKQQCRTISDLSANCANALMASCDASSTSSV